MESDTTMPRKNTTRTITTGNNGDTLLDDSHLVSPATQTVTGSTIDSGSNFNTMHYPFDTMATDKSQLEALRLETLRGRYHDTGLNDSSVGILASKHLKESTTNRSYRYGQHLFLHWASVHNVSVTRFSPLDVINFLSDLHIHKKLQVGTLRLARTAITHFHENPVLIRNNVDISSFLNTLADHAPPIRLHKPTIDLGPTFHQIQKIIPESSTRFSDLQRKLAFLLAITCFLRLSDLARITFSSIQVNPTHTHMTFDVVAPKEKRKHRKIIKTFKVKAHSHEQMCPIRTFIALASYSLPSRRPNGPLFPPLWPYNLESPKKTL
ncbi:hypothetical protein G6F56_012397 [Rhizopus delemar]|nr:hypothetical protein G6F56_012397 [Rhizopus delemar]